MGIKRYSAAYRSTNECDEGLYVLHEDHVASHAYDEAKERELFEAEFDKPDTAKFDGEEYRYSGQADRTEMVLFLEFFGAWSGWKKCAKSRAGSAE